jgi:hypothetical protein
MRPRLLLALPFLLLLAGAQARPDAVDLPAARHGLEERAECGGTAPAESSCYNGAHQYFFVLSHGVTWEPGFTGRITSLLSYGGGVMYYTCSVDYGERLACESQGAPPPIFLSSLTQTCGTTDLATGTLAGGEGAWTCYLRHFGVN